MFPNHFATATLKLIVLLVGDLWSGSRRPLVECRRSTPGQTTHGNHASKTTTTYNKVWWSRLSGNDGVEMVWVWRFPGSIFYKINAWWLYLAKSDQLITNKITVLLRIDKPKALSWVFPVGNMQSSSLAKNCKSSDPIRLPTLGCIVQMHLLLLDRWRRRLTSIMGKSESEKKQQNLGGLSPKRGTHLRIFQDLSWISNIIIVINWASLHHLISNCWPKHLLVALFSKMAWSWVGSIDT